jgi:hypothetical protein
MKYNAKKAIAVGIVLIIFGIGIFSFVCIKEKAKSADGIPVECTVTDVTIIGKRRYADGYYFDKDGNQVDVEIVNAGRVFVNDTIDAYILPDNPNTAQVKSPMSLMLFAGAFSGIVCLGGLFIIKSVLKEVSEKKLLDAEGKFTKGRIIDVRVDGDKNVKFYFAKISYQDADGIEHTFEDCDDKHRLSRAGEIVNVRYAVKKNGKYANDVI